jgi:lambda family phage portal protein
MNILDEVIAFISPDTAINRAAARAVLASYDAAKPSRTRKMARDGRSSNQIVSTSARQLRTQARNLERNHDIARGAIRTLVNNIVGANGIGIEPQPRKKGTNEIHEEYAQSLREAWRDWQRKPEVTWGYRWPAVQRMMARTWIRDGEAFAQSIIGNVAGLDHGTKVPFSLEIMEPDMIPLDYDDASNGIRQGIQRNAWGRPTGYWLYKNDPLENGFGFNSTETTGFGSPLRNNLKFLSADKMLHIASTDRIGQLRGVSEFASVITRLDDIKDYEESERVAAKIAAMLTAYVKRGTPDMYDENNAVRDAEGNIVPSEISLSPGTIVDSLAIGEEIGLIDSKRPNPNLITFRQGQLRAVAAGIGGSYSSISRDYNGTYSAQRQELVEQWIHYASLTDEFTGQFIQPVWERFVLAAHLSGAVPMPKDIEFGTHDDALFVGQSMPWIDPAKEATAWLNLVQSGFASEVEVMRKRGVNPRDVLEQIATFRKEAGDKGLKFSSDYANTNQASQPAPEQPTEDQAQDPAMQAMASIASGLGILASREQPAPNVVFNQAPTTVNLADTHIDVAAPVVNVAAADITVENIVEPTPVNVENNIAVPQAQVVVNSHKRSVQTVERDAETLEVTRTVTEFE